MSRKLAGKPLTTEVICHNCNLLLRNAYCGSILKQTCRPRGKQHRVALLTAGGEGRAVRRRQCCFVKDTEKHQGLQGRLVIGPPVVLGLEALDPIFPLEICIRLICMMVVGGRSKDVKVPPLSR
jgi:hypothetical protein